MTRLSVPDMSCGHCKATVEAAIAGVDAKARVTVDLGSRTVEVESAEPAPRIIAALSEAGYSAAVA